MFKSLPVNGERAEAACGLAADTSSQSEQSDKADLFPDGGVTQFVSMVCARKHPELELYNSTRREVNFFYRLDLTLQVLVIADTSNHISYLRQTRLRISKNKSMMSVTAGLCLYKLHTYVHSLMGCISPARSNASLQLVLFMCRLVQI